MITRLVNRRLLSLYGPDAREFLQGLISADLRTLQCHTDDPLGDRHDTGTALEAVKRINLLPSLFLSSNGRILAESLIFRRNDEFILDCGTHTFEKLVQVINRRKLAAKVTMVPLENGKVYAKVPDYYSPCTTHFATAPTASSHGALEFVDPRGDAFGTRIYKMEECNTSIQGVVEANDSLGIHEKMLIINGCIVELLDNLTELKLLPQDLNLEKMGYVSKDKGCFIGQEIMNRIFNKTLLKKYNLMLVLSMDGIAGAPTHHSDALLNTPLGVSLGKLLECDKEGVRSAMSSLLYKASRVHSVTCEKSLVPLLYFSTGFGFVLNRMNAINSVTINDKTHVCLNV